MGGGRLREGVGVGGGGRGNRTQAHAQPQGHYKSVITGRLGPVLDWEPFEMNRLVSFGGFFFYDSSLVPRPVRLSRPFFFIFGGG